MTFTDEEGCCWNDIRDLCKGKGCLHTCHIKNETFIVEGSITFTIRPESMEVIPLEKKTITLDVTTTVPVEVVQDALAGRALEILRRHILRAAKHAVDDFVANGISASLEDVAVKAEKKTVKYTVDNPK